MTLMGPAVSVSSLALAFAGLLFVVGSRPAAVGAEPCCAITRIDTRASLITAQDATGRTFQFSVKDSLVLFTLKVGQRIDADFAARKVSIESGKACCDIVGDAPSAVPARPVVPRVAVGAPPSATAATVITLPKALVATGPVARTSLQHGTQWESRRLSTTVDGQPAEFEVLHLRGLKGIEAANLPESAKAFLLAHARTLPPDEVADYVVNRKQVEEWARTHPLPEALKKKGGGSHGECHSISMHCAGEAAKHAAKEADKQAEALREQAHHEWNHVSREVGRDLKMAEQDLLKCFADHRKSSGPRGIGSIKLPGKLRFNGPLAAGTDGKISGSADIRAPILLDNATIEVEVFVIPCAFAVTALPVWVRPRSLHFVGDLTVDTSVTVDLHASGSIKKRKIPLKLPSAVTLTAFVIPIDVVPVEVDIRIEFIGDVDVEADGAFEASLCAFRQQKIHLDFYCDGKQCGGTQRRLTVDQKPVYDLKLAAQGQALIRPAIFTPLVVDVNFGALAARVGPEFYVTAKVEGAAAARAGSSGTRGAGTGAVAGGLSATLSGGVDIRYFLDLVRPEYVAQKAAKSWEHRDPLIGPIDFKSITVTSPAPAPQTGKPAATTAKCST